ncbi:MAG: inositol monophosphatase [Burkholderiaceae bacterium]|nr:inositol monophosphatase [Burkholderiaceae bacterium]
MQQQHPMLNIAIKAARRAGSIISRAALDLETVRVSTKGAGDFVTEVDQAVEKDILDTLLHSYPEHGFLAEESGLMGNENSPYRWIIDPLDGTVNFIHGFPYYAVSIALSFEGEVITGCIFAPASNDLYTTEKGRGSMLNNRRLRVSKRSRFSEALLGSNIPNRRSGKTSASWQLSSELTLASSGVRRLGASVLDLAYVAAGRMDGYVGADLQAWDMAVGSLLIKEAGGLVSDMDGEENYMGAGTIVAGNPKIFAQLLAKVQPAAGVSLKGEQAQTSSQQLPASSSDSEAGHEKKISRRVLHRKVS